MERVFGDVFQAYVRYLDTVGTVVDGAAVDRVGTFDEWLGGTGRTFGLAVIDYYAPGAVASGRATLESSQVLGSSWRGRGRDGGSSLGDIGFECSIMGASGSQAVGDGSDFGEERVDEVKCADVSEEPVVRGKNYNRNRKKRAARREAAKVESSCRGNESRNGVGEGFVEKPKDALRLSLEEKWRVENELKIAKAKKELDLLQSEDREAIKKLRNRKVQGATERTMVQIEKAHASLVQTGNVPGVQPGFCQTVVDGEIVESVPGLSGGEFKECSISPSSSISEREVRELKKAYEDLKLENEKLKRKQRRMPLAFRVALGEEDVPVSMVGGRVPESAKEALDEVIGEEEWTYEGDEDANPNLLYLRKELLF